MSYSDIRLPFVKMSGAGNDFIVIDHRQEIVAKEDMAELVRKICRRRFSVGADGVIFIENFGDEADFCWQFFNSDGSLAEMCGNGARCAARFAYTHGIAPASMRFSTLAGIIEARVEGDDVAIKMTKPVNLKLGQTVKTSCGSMEVHSLDTGVPHAVVLVDDIDKADVLAMGREIRNHEMFMPAGTNVNFVSRMADGYKVRTYERGVEAETMACGTGAVASALILAMLGKSDSPTGIITSGGDKLVISFSLDKEEAEADNVYLKGPARIIYRGELNSEALI